MNRVRSPFGPVFALAFALAFAFARPAGASAQMEHDDALRLSGHLALGFAGEGDLSIDTILGTAVVHSDLDPTLGFGFRVEKPLFDFLSIGVMFETLSFLVDDSDREREWAFNFDALIRARYMFEAVRGELFLEPYLALPVGFTFGWLDDPDGDGDEAWPGWNIGALAGLAVIHSSRFGGFLELGWRHLEVYTHVEALGGSDYAVTVNEFAMNLGVSYLLE